jgi:hypothetical protein
MPHCSLDLAAAYWRAAKFLRIKSYELPECTGVTVWNTRKILYGSIPYQTFVRGSTYLALAKSSMN